MKSPDSPIPENMNWADYCDALHAESWSRLNAGKRIQRTADRARAADNESRTRAANSIEETATTGAH
jgi:hypothetical protein